MKNHTATRTATNTATLDIPTFIATITLAIMVTLLSVVPASAEQGAEIAPRYALLGNVGNSYSPGNEISFFQFGAAALYDYDQVWPHRAPEPLRFKVEGSAGLAHTPHTRTIVAANMLAEYYLDPLATTTLRPYFEAGIGIIYTDYQVKDQGLRINFNPLLGVGSEIHCADSTYFIAARLHHLSNGGLDSDNRAINSVMLQFGRFF